MSAHPLPSHAEVGGFARVDFPLCPDPRHQGPLRRVLERCVGLLLTRLGQNSLVAVVLTGSLARGEGSIMVADRLLRVLGDIEFLVVLRSEVDYHRVRPHVAAWSREASQAVADEVRVEIEFGPVELGYLRRRALPSIFVHDLITHGKVLWGPADILNEVPRFGRDAIPRDDALHLVFNRTIEQLEAYDRADEVEGEALWELAYQRLKLDLDLAGSALAFTGRHQSSYAQRPAAFARLLAETPALARELPPRYLDELDQATRLKLTPATGEEVLPSTLPIAAQRAWVRGRILAGIPAVTAVLTWELRELLGRDDHLRVLLSAWMERQPVRRRAWEWAKVALHPLRAPLPLASLRAARLAFRSTPRALLYTAGTLAYLNLDRPTAPRASIARLLFVRGEARRRPDMQRRAVTALWRWCVRNT